MGRLDIKSCFMYNEIRMAEEKKRVSKKQFAELLYYWLSQHVSEEAIRRKAREFKFKVKDKADFNRIFKELLIFNSWMIIHACEGIFGDEDKRNECLDIFHRFLHEGKAKDIESDFHKWMYSMSLSYIDYYKAMQTKHPQGYLWVLAKQFNENLFGELNKDIDVQMAIIIHAGAFISASIKTFGKYEVV